MIVQGKPVPISREVDCGFRQYCSELEETWASMRDWASDPARKPPRGRCRCRIRLAEPWRLRGYRHRQAPYQAEAVAAIFMAVPHSQSGPSVPYRLSFLKRPLSRAALCEFLEQAGPRGDVSRPEPGSLVAALEQPPSPLLVKAASPATAAAVDDAPRPSRQPRSDDGGRSYRRPRHSGSSGAGRDAACSKGSVLDAGLEEFAYEDNPLPIAEQQTIS